jgi:Na+-driven multidrug efflux pump
VLFCKISIELWLLSDIIKRTIFQKVKFYSIMHESQKYELDMCNGPLFSKIVLFSIPLILTGILQLLYNAVDIVVVGQFVGSNALAAVGSTTVKIGT